MKSNSYFFLVLLILLAGCRSNPTASDPQDIFSIYLVKDSNQFYTEAKPPINQMILEKEPLLSINSIAGYDWQNHQIAFSESVQAEIKSRESLLHYLFVIVANDERIYWGMFLDDADSFGCPNPVIRLLPRHLNPGSTVPNGFVIDNGYPVASGKDLRYDARIFRALKKTGKLIH